MSALGHPLPGPPRPSAVSPFGDPIVHALVAAALAGVVLWSAAPSVGVPVLGLGGTVALLLGLALGRWPAGLTPPTLPPAIRAGLAGILVAHAAAPAGVWWLAPSLAVPLALLTPQLRGRAWWAWIGLGAVGWIGLAASLATAPHGLAPWSVWVSTGPWAAIGPGLAMGLVASGSVSGAPVPARTAAWAVLALVGMAAIGGLAVERVALADDIPRVLAMLGAGLAFLAAPAVAPDVAGPRHAALWGFSALLGALAGPSVAPWALLVGVPWIAASQVLGSRPLPADAGTLVRSLRGIVPALLVLLGLLAAPALPTDRVAAIGLALTGAAWVLARDPAVARRLVTP